jgi:hypothetical protein
MLLALAVLAGRGGYDGRLLISPLDLHSPQFSVRSVERFCKDAFLMTYMIEIPVSVMRGTLEQIEQTEQIEKQGTAIATNSHYPLIMGYRMIRGAFFTARAWDNGERHAVLNEAAAWALFGSTAIAGKSIAINGERFLVTGAIDDESDEEIIYLPSSVEDSSGTERTASSFMALLSAERGVTKAYAEHALKALGIQAAHFSVTGVSDIERMYWERLRTSLKALYCAAFFVAAYGAWLRCKGVARRYKSWMRRYYLPELLYKNRAALIKIAARGILFCIAASAALWFMPHILTAFLNGRGSISAVFTDDCFSRKTALLRIFYLPDTAAFAASLVFICGGGAYCAWKTRVNSARFFAASSPQ